jgi:hypothetical protein
MNSTASAGFEPRSEAHGRRCGGGIKSRWSPWEVGAMVAGFVVFWPLGLLALFLKWKNGEMWRGASDSAAPWASFKKPDFQAWSGWKPQSAGYGFSGSGNAAFDAYKREQLQRLDEERRKLEDEQKAFRDFVEKVRRAKDQDEFDRFMSERSAPQTPATDAPQA